jgi:hypothetical protein
MLGIENNDSSFFNITSQSISEIQNKVLNQDIVNLSITEEIYKMASGTITMHDPNQIYSTLFKFGVILQIEWGYKRMDNPIYDIFVKTKSPSEISGVMSRKNKFIVMSPSGGGDQNGYSDYNCNLYSLEYAKKENKNIYKTGTKQDIIQQVLLRMGVDSWTILFTKGSDLVSDSQQIVQTETDFLFLQKKALEWGCIFKITQTPEGLLYCLFVDRDQFYQSDYYKQSLGKEVKGNIKTLNWKKGIPNVIRYTWQNHAGESGTGDNIMIVPDGKGQFTFIHYQAEGDNIISYKFVPERVSEELKRRSAVGGVSNQIDFVKWAMNQNDFSTLVEQGYFVRYDQSTAPQGLGYTVEVDMLGDPNVIPPLLVNFGAGFPDLFHNNSGFFISKVTHVINKNGYKAHLTINDVLGYTGGQLIMPQYT